jgi:sugar lactone lactonase YvrE
VRDPDTFEARSWTVPGPDGGVETVQGVHFSSPLGKIGGLAAGNDRLYVSDWENREIRIVDTTSSPPEEIDSFSVGTSPSPRPGMLALDHKGRLWIARLATYPDRLDWNFNKNPDSDIECWDTDGTRCASSQTITGLDNPTALAIDPNPLLRKPSIRTTTVCS